MLRLRWGWRVLRERDLFDDGICECARRGAGRRCFYAFDEEREPSFSRFESSAAVFVRWAGGADEEDLEGARGVISRLEQEVKRLRALNQEQNERRFKIDEELRKRGNELKCQGESLVRLADQEIDALVGINGC